MSPRGGTIKFFTAVRGLTLTYLKQRFAASGLGELEIEGIASKAAAEIDAVVRAAVEEASRHARTTGDASARTVAPAWRTLGLSPPRKVKESDMKRAWSAKRKIARACHPDLNSGVGAQEQLDEAIRAYALLERVYGSPGSTRWKEKETTDGE